MTDTNELEQKSRSGLSDLTGKLAAVDDDMVLKAVYESGLHQYAPGVLRSDPKDGIAEPHAALMNFARKICKAANTAIYGSCKVTYWKSTI
jgi:hypothetical protein